MAKDVELCETCNGFGEVGSLQPYGYDGDVCPTCEGTGTSRTLTETYSWAIKGKFL